MPKREYKLCGELVTLVEHAWRHKQSRFSMLLQVHDHGCLQTLRARVGGLSSKLSILAGAKRLGGLARAWTIQAR